VRAHHGGGRADEVRAVLRAFTPGRTDRRDDTSRFGAPVVDREGGEHEHETSHEPSVL
jgi:hypothetical protein